MLQHQHLVVATNSKIFTIGSFTEKQLTLAVASSAHDFVTFTFVSDTDTNIVGQMFPDSS